MHPILVVVSSSLGYFFKENKEKGLHLLQITKGPPGRHVRSPKPPTYSTGRGLCSDGGICSCSLSLPLPLPLLLICIVSSYALSVSGHNPIISMPPQQAAPPARSEIRSVHRPYQRLFRVPPPSPPIHRGHLLDVPAGILCAGPLGKPLHPISYSSPTGPQSVSLLQGQRRHLPRAPILEQPERPIPAKVLDRDARRSRVR